MSFVLWTPEEQPDILGGADSFGNIEWTYPEFIESIYEPLRRKYPDYISRRSLGYDTSGEYEMWAYEFTPRNYKKTVYLQSGVHVIETDAYFGLARLLTLIAEGKDARLAYIRENIRLLVVPVVSVWGISKRGSYEEIMDGDRWRFPHNAARVNANRDFADCKAEETKNIIRYIEGYKKEIDFAIDCHSTTDVVLGVYLLPYANGMPLPLERKLCAINDALYEKHPTTVKRAFMGKEENYPVPNLKNTYNYGIYERFGILGITTEHNDYIYDDRLGTRLTMTLAVELMGNHLLQICEDDEFHS